MRIKFILTLFILFSLYAQESVDVKPKIKLNKEQLRELSKVQESSENNTSDKSIPDNQDPNVVEDGKNITNTFDILEIDGIKYIKDGLRYIPIISTQSENNEGGIAKIEESKSDELSNDDTEVVNDEIILKSSIDNFNQDLTYYGYDIFNGNPEIFQASTFGSVDPNYNIGPEDQIIVLLWGEAQFRKEYIVSREGNIFIDDIGPVSVNGLNLETLENKLFQIYSKLYSTLNPSLGTPTTYLDVSLGNLRPLRVIALGEVAQPGGYTVSPATSLSSVLYYFRGPTTMGSLREINLIRKGKTIGQIDFYDYLLSGKTLDDFQLFLDDIIFVPPRKNTVTISGEINRPAIYELLDNEGLKDLIKISGGLKITAYMGRAQIDRVVPPEDRFELGMDRMLIDIDLQKIMSSSVDYPIRDGDKVKLFSILNARENTLEISGSIVRPGFYDYEPDLRLKDLILSADSLVGDAYLERADIVRPNSDFTETLIKVNLQSAMSNDENQNILLRPMDRVRIYSLSEMIAPKYVSISGFVQNPGSYRLLNDMNLYDLLFLSGGYADEAWLDKIYLDRADLIRINLNDNNSRIIPFNLGSLLNNIDSKEINWDLKEGDAIRVYSNKLFNNTKPVTINGSVRTPGTYTFKSNMSIRDLILESGGVSENVYLYNIEIARIDPFNKNHNKYAKIIKLEMFSDYSISNIKYSNLNSNYINIERNEFELKPYDLVSIRPDPNFSLQKTVQIAGEINYPGDYSLTGPNERVSDIINRAGGLRKEAFPMASILIRNNDTVRVSFDKIIKRSSSKENFKLLNGDKIIINSHPNIVTIIGEVNAPGKYKFYNNENLRSYIRIAGGLTVDAEKREISVMYANGMSKQLRRFFPSPKIYDGSIIKVGTKNNTDPLNRTELAKEMASILADFLNIYISLTLLVRSADSL